MEIGINSILIITLLCIAVQDLKHTAIHIVLPLILVIAATVYAYYYHTIPVQEYVYSLGFVLLCLVVIVIQYSIKQQQLANPFETVFGLGDVAYLLAIIPLFSFRNYLLYFVSGMLISLLVGSVVKLITKNEAIPLAGYLALYLIGIFSYKVLFSIPHLLSHNLY